MFKSETMFHRLRDLPLWFMLISKAFGSMMTINPSELFSDAARNPPILTMTCNISSSDLSTEVSSILYIRIGRNRTHYLIDTEEIIAVKLHETKAMVTEAAADIKDKVINISGSLRIGKFSDWQHHMDRVHLTVTWNSSLINCRDEGEYFCIVGVLDQHHRFGEWSSSSTLVIQRSSNDTCKINGKQDEIIAQKDHTTVYIVGAVVGISVAIVAVAVTVLIRRNEASYRSEIGQLSTVTI